jgi:tight adherence protein C
MSIPILAAMFVGTTILLLIFGFSSSLSSRKARLDWRKRAQGKGENPHDSATFVRKEKNVSRFLGALGEAAKPKNEAELSHVRKTLARAGYRRHEAIIAFYGAKIVCAILFPTAIAFIRFSGMAQVSSALTLVAFVIMAVAGFYLPHLWMMLKISSRKARVSEGFPDALDLMVVCVESGLGLDAAIDKVGEELKMSNKVLSEEFQLLNLSMRAGQGRQEALRGLGERTDLEDVHNLVTLLIQTDRFGTSIAQTLRVHSDTMRTKRHQRAETLAAKLPVKLLFPLIFFIFPSLFIAILGPAVIQLYRVLLPTLAGSGG